MATIYVDGKPLEVDGADNLLRACLSLGIDIPYFCWHPALGSVGACRQCAVKQFANADDKRGRLVMSCMTPATDNTYISVDDEEAKAFRESVIEWLMTNHPHDCPVCEEGGHCHLQDMTVMTGHSERRYRFTKRTHQNQDLGPFINHEMNRCIACYRCVRYYDDYAGGTDLGVFGAHDNVYFGRAEPGVLESEFSGNLTEVCPTGVFTDKTHSARYNRKWDMQYAPSVCQSCSVGCNVSPGERYGEIRRIENRYNGSVNQYFLCDRGRFGYGYVNRADRPRQAEFKGEIVTTETALATITDHLRTAKRVIGIGSARASLESNFALKQLVGDANFSHGMTQLEADLVNACIKALNGGAVRTPSVVEIEDADAVIVLGEDVTQTAARVALALRQAAKNKGIKLAGAKKVLPWQADAIHDIAQHDKSPIFIASFAETRLDDVATETFHAPAENIARLGFAVANLIDSSAPAVADIDAETAALAKRIADELLAADNPLVVSGIGAQSVAVIEAAANIANALQARGKKAALSLQSKEVNSTGLGLLAPQSLSIESALNQIAKGEADVLVVMENDLYRRVDASRVDEAIAAAKALIVVDHQRTQTAEKATLVLPAASFAEADGTVVSSEGRAQRFFQVYDPQYLNLASQIRDSWRWLDVLNNAASNYQILDDVTAACAQSNALLSSIVDAAPSASYRVDGKKIARMPHRSSGRTAMRANISVHEPRVPQDVDSALAFSMEGYAGPLEAGPMTPFAWAPGWNSPQSWNKFQDEVGGHLKQGDPGVRLLEPKEGSAAKYSNAIPAAFKSENGKFRVLPLQHLFGGDEMSARSEVMQQRMPQPYVKVSSADAERLGLTAGKTVRISHALSLPVEISRHLPQGTVGIPQGLSGLPVFAADSSIELQGVQA
jgi:NADH-quinone oxidoreductase subunit G